MSPFVDPIRFPSLSVSYRYVFLNVSILIVSMRIPPHAHTVAFDVVWKCLLRRHRFERTKIRTRRRATTIIFNNRREMIIIILCLSLCFIEF